MVDWKVMEKFRKLSKAKQVSVITDRTSISEVMRKNLASDITNGKYGMRQVVRQMVYIEDYEETTQRMIEVLTEVN